MWNALRIAASATIHPFGWHGRACATASPPTRSQPGLEAGKAKRALPYPQKESHSPLPKRLSYSVALSSRGMSPGNASFP